MKPAKETIAPDLGELRRALRALEERLNSVIDIFGGFYWEQDKNFRFVSITGALLGQLDIDVERMIGKTPWEIASITPVSDGGNWDAHRGLLAAHRSFDDLIYRFVDTKGQLRYASASGRPTFDARGHFTGYRGVVRDISASVQLQRRNAAEHGVARSLADATTVTGAIQAVLRSLCQTLDWSCGARWEVDDTGRFLDLRESWGIADPAVQDLLAAIRSQPSTSASDESLVQRAYVKRQPQWITDLSREPAFRRVVAAAGVHGGFAFPILSEGKILGVLQFFGVQSAYAGEAELLLGAANVGRSIGQYLERKQAEDELQRFQLAMDASSDMIHVTDRETLRFLWVNQRSCEVSGCSREELLEMGPLKVLRVSRAELERTYDEVIAAGPVGTTEEVRGFAKDGTGATVEVRRRALQLGSRWVIVTISQDVGARRRAEQSTARLGRMFAALSTTNEAIMRASSPAELYQRVCDAAVEHGKFVNAAVMLHDPNSRRFNVVSVSGKDATVIQSVEISSDPTLAQGRGLVGSAYRDGKPSVSNNVMQDERLSAWREPLHQDGVNAAAAVPLMRGGRSVGVLYLESSERRSFDDEIVKLLERMAENLVFALDSFNREAERERAQQALRESEEKYRAILENMTDGYFEVDLQGNYTFFNDTLCRLHGYSREELTGMSYRRYYDPETAKKVLAVYMRVYNTGEPAQLLEWPFIHKDGSVRIYESSVQLIVDDHGQRTGFRGITRDVTSRRQAAEALRASEEKYRTILENIEDAYYEVNLVGDLTFFNTAFCRMIGYSETELKGINNRVYQRPEAAARVYKTFNRVFRTGVPTDAYDWEMVRKDGSTMLAEGSVHLIKDAAGNPLGFRGMLRDVTARRQMERDLRDSEARFRALTDLSSDWYWEQDAEFRFTRIEGHPEKVEDGWSRKLLLGLRAWETGFDVENEGGWNAHQALLSEHRPYRDVVMRLNLAEGRRYISVSGEPVLDKDGGFAGYRGIAREITQQKRAEERVQYLATHDGLTGLPNRVMFGELLGMAIQSSQRYQRKFGVLFIDLDRFKIINDTLGHEAGDILLKEMAARLNQCLRTSDVVARLGGDEFVVLIQEVNEVEQVTAVARKILATVLKPVVVAGQECRVTASIGICMYPTDAQDEHAVMKNADIAMYFAKERGKNNFQFYSEETKSQSIERLALEAYLRRALEHRELSLHYQAKADLGTGRITGVEALLRWQHPNLGAMAPAQFIPLAEETGLIVPIGKWVLETACAQGVAWQRQGLAPVRVAVNLSARQFADENLLGDIATVLSETGFDPALLELEITEGMVMQNADRAVQLLSSIKRMGVHLAIDDFGTGYSSLAQIKRFPIDTLKIDRSFIRDIPGDVEDQAIAKAIIAMAKTLDLTVVAEGVETMDQVQFLRDNACDEMQGYYFSKPVVPEQFATLLHAHAPAPKN